MQQLTDDAAQQSSGLTRRRPTARAVHHIAVGGFLLAMAKISCLSQSSDPNPMAIT